MNILNDDLRKLIIYQMRSGNFNWEDNKNNFILSDRQLMFTLVQQDPLKLYYASKDLKNDKEIVLNAVQRDGRVLEVVPTKLKNDREVVLAAVHQYGYALQYASKAMTNDKEVVLAAVQKHGWALEYASDDLKRNDRDIILAAIQQDGRVLEVAPVAMKNDKDVVLAAIQQDALALEFASATMKSDRQIVLRALDTNELVFKYLPLSLKNDLEINIATAAKWQFQSNFLERWYGETFEERKQSIIDSVNKKASDLNEDAIILASRMGLVWEFGLADLVQQNSEGLRTIDKTTGLLPFMLAASSSYHSNAPPQLCTIYLLMKACPDVVLMGSCKGLD